MMMRSIGPDIFGSVYDAPKFAVADFPRQSLQIIPQLFAEGFEFTQERGAIVLQLVPDGLALFRGGRLAQLDQQQVLLSEILVSDLVEVEDEILDRVGHPAQVTQQILVITVLGNHGRRGRALSQGVSWTNQAERGRAQ